MIRGWSHRRHKAARYLRRVTWDATRRRRAALKAAG